MSTKCFLQINNDKIGGIDWKHVGVMWTRSRCELKETENEAEVEHERTVMACEQANWRGKGRTILS